ncbi:hypothetical protein F5141DRAFT_1002494, partial [Pisolithus sp. B1]
QHNMLLHAKALEVNTDHPSRTEYSLTEIQTMVKDDEQLQNLMQEELEQHVIALNEHCDMKIHGIRANNVTAAQDVLATTDRITKEVCSFISVGHINDSIQSMWTTTDNSAEFWEDITNKKHIVMNYQSYETAIIETYGVCLVGWPEDVRFTNPSAIGTVAEAWKLRDVLHSRTCFWKKLSKSELDIFATELNAHHVASKTI